MVLFVWVGSQEWLLCKDSPESCGEVSAFGRPEHTGLISAPGVQAAAQGLVLSSVPERTGPWDSRFPDIRSGYGCPLRGSRAVREVGRAFQAQLWKSNRIHLASSDHTTVLGSKLCLNFKMRGATGISSEPRAPWARCALPSWQRPSSCSSLCFSV